MAPTNPARLSDLREAFAALLSGRPILPLNRGRTGLTLALQAFAKTRSRALEVIVPAYICPSVVQAVQSAGLKAVPVDIGPDLNIDRHACENAISTNTLAVIVAHMYGCPAPIQEIEQVCRRRGVFLIDDSAQVVGVSVNGQSLGTFGDVGVISFSQSKTIVAGCRNAGGLLIVNNPQFEKELVGAYENLPPSSGGWSDIATYIWEYILARWTTVPTYYFRRVLELVRTSGADKPELSSRMNSMVAALALEQLKSLTARIEGRKRAAKLYQHKVATQQAVEFPQFAPGRYLTRVLLKLPDTANLPVIRDRLRKRGIQTRVGYPAYGATQTHAPQRAMSLQPRLLELPSHSGMSAETVDTVWSSLMSTLEG